MFRVTAYGIAAFTLKNLCAEFVGNCHDASIRFVLTMTVYTRASPLVFRLCDQVTNGVPLAIMAHGKIHRKSLPLSIICSAFSIRCTLCGVYCIIRLDEFAIRNANNGIELCEVRPQRMSD